ncbi:MAG: polysaccharide deacetylase family protein [Acidobacteria bacterium]|nr:polysaccharide deacetylase family protein [Acidobacteriota bacterium]
MPRWRDMRNALSVDFEDWYQPLAARHVAGWERFPSRVPDDARRLVDLLGRHSVRCTFFVLGEVATEFPDAVRAIHRAGHEVASHGHRHVPLFAQPRERFERETREAIDRLEQLTGERVLGFRAPFFSIRRDSLWAIDSLRQLGLVYDSSIHPTAGVLHGYRDGGRVPYTHPNGLREFPITTFPLAGAAVPFGGGVYYRLLPYPCIRHGLKRLNGRAIGGNVYFHPREIDPTLPRLSTGWKLKLIMYAGTRSFETKLEHLLDDFAFGPIREWL